MPLVVDEDLCVFDLGLGFLGHFHTSDSVPLFFARTLFRTNLFLTSQRGVLMRFIVGGNGPSKRPRLALCATLGWFADLNEIH